MKVLHFASLFSRKGCFLTIIGILLLQTQVKVFAQYKQPDAGIHSNYEQMILFNNKKKLLVRDRDSVIKYWSLETGKLIHTFTEQRYSYPEIVLLPDKKTFMTYRGNPYNSDTTIKCWSLKTGKLIQTYQNFTGRIDNLVLLPDKKTFLANSAYYPASSEAPIILLFRCKDTVQTLRDNRITQWSIKTGRLLRSFEGHLGYVCQIVVLPDKTFLSFGGDYFGENEVINHWSLKTGKLIHSFTGLAWYYYNLVLLPDKKSFLVVDKDSIVRHWSLETGKLIHSFEGHKARIYESVLLPGNQSILTYGEDGTIKYWSLQTGKLIYSYEGHTGSVYEIILHPDKKTFLTRSEDNTVKYWSLKTGKLIHSFEKDSIDKIMLLPDNKTLLTRSKDNTVKSWSLETGKLIHNFGQLTMPVTLLPDGKTFISAYNYKTMPDFERKHPDFEGEATNTYYLIRQWSLETGKIVKTFEGYFRNLTKIILLEDKKSFLAFDYDNIIKRWDIASGKNTITYQLDELMQTHKMLDKHKLLVTTKSGNYKIIDLRKDK